MTPIRMTPNKEAKTIPIMAPALRLEVGTTTGTVVETTTKVVVSTVVGEAFLTK